MSQPVLKGRYRKLVLFLAILYALAVAYLCFSIQPFLVEGITTPNIIYWGRLRLLLVPFNSFVSVGSLTSFREVFWIFGQNVSNVFLLYPLGLCLMFLFDKWRSWKASLLLGFQISLFIETTQLLDDLVFNANRVFEIDDLWSNSLGVLLAYGTYRLISRKRIKVLLK